MKRFAVNGSRAITSGSPMPITARPPGRSTRASSAQASSSSVVKYTVLMVISASTEPSSNGSSVREPQDRRGRPDRTSRLNRAAQHLVRDLDAMHDAIVADAVQQQLQSDSAAESDVRDGAPARHLRCVNRSRDRPCVSSVEEP